MINVFIFIVSFLIILSKFLDCYTTSTQISALSQERNPLARIFMKKFGIQKTIWGVFFLAIIIVSISNWLLFTYYDKTIFKVIFIIISLIVSISQFAVAHTNKTKKLNFFTKFLLKIY